MAILYKEIYLDLLKNMRDGVYNVGDQLPTEKALSLTYNVSRITSKRALQELEKDGFVVRISGKGTFVSKVAKSDENKPQYNKQDTQGIIAMIFPFSSDMTSFSYSLKCAIEILEKNNFSIRLYSRFTKSVDVEHLLEELLHNGTKGIIYYPYSLVLKYELLNRFVFKDFPIVTLDKHYSGIDIDYVSSDNVKGGEIATNYLIELGHSRIAFLSDLAIENVSSVRDRYLGYCNALKNKGFPYDPELVHIDNKNFEYERMYIEEDYVNIVKDFFNNGVTAIFAINDIVASFVLRAAKSCNIDVPSQLSVIGFDGLPFSMYQEVPITTVMQDFSKLGECAANMIMSKLEGKPYEKNQIVPVSLVERDSCARKSDE